MYEKASPFPLEFHKKLRKNIKFAFLSKKREHFL